MLTHDEGCPGPRGSAKSKVINHATESAGLTGFHMHDPRHTGNHIAAATGAGLRELMGRMGHSTARAALIYQHRMGAGDENRTRTISLGS